MPRSGTKLVRELLNGHSLISLAPIESHVLPLWVERWPDYGDLSRREVFEQFARNAYRLPYFMDVLYLGEPLISGDEWYRRCADFTPGGVFRALMQHGAGIAAEDRATRWGDKTPEYLVHLDLLFDLFPEGQVVHVVRDPRDQALSARKAWGKNLIRSAQRWTDSLSAFRAQAARYPDRIAELRFESLLNDPEGELRGLADFLGVPFERGMLSVPMSNESSGAARGAAHVVATNQGAYRTALAPSLRRRIEEITLPLLHHYGYPIEYADRVRPVSRQEMRWLKLRDGVGVVRAEARDKGWLRGPLFVARSLRSSRT